MDKSESQSFGQFIGSNFLFSWSDTKFGLFFSSSQPESDTEISYSESDLSDSVWGNIKSESEFAHVPKD